MATEKPKEKPQDNEEQRLVPTPDQVPGNAHRADIASLHKQRRADGETAQYADADQEFLDKHIETEGEPPPKEVPRETKPKEPEAPEPEAGTTTPQETTTDVGDDGTESATIRVKVRGREFDAPREDVDNAGGVEAFQKLKAADEILAAAKEHEKRLRTQVAPEAQPQAPEIDIDKLADDIALGDTEARRAALKAVFDARPTTGTSEPKGNLDADIALHLAIAESKRDNADIWGDPDLSEKMFKEDERLREEDPFRDPGARIAEAVDLTREWVKRISVGTGQPQPATETVQDRQTRKARTAAPSAASAPGGNGAAQPAQKPMTQQERHAAGLADLRKGRGQL